MRRQLEEREGTGVARDRKERNAGGRKRERAIERACNAQIYVCPLERGGKERYMGGERKREDEEGGGGGLYVPFIAQAGYYQREENNAEKEDLITTK